MKSSGKENIKVVPYDPLWPKQFEIESQKIKKSLGDNCITVHHVGSTAIPGMWAKPVIDMIPVVKDIFLVEQQNAGMEKLGYLAKGEYGMLFRRYFQRKSPLPACNVHVFEAGSDEIERLILFRDFLINNDEYKEKYADLKRKISEKTDDITTYTLAKDFVVKEIDDLIGFQGYRIVHALSEREWEAYYRILQDQAYNAQNVVFNDTHSERTEIKNNHLVLYKGTNVIGAALIEFNANNQGAIKYLAIDKLFQNLGDDSIFHRDVEKWLHHCNHPNERSDNLSESDSVYCEENAPLFEAMYSKNLISLGGFTAIDHMFSDLNVRGLNALDLGFGLGGVAFYLAESYQMNVSGVEIHPWMAQYAQNHAPKNVADRLEFVVYNTKGEIPYKAESFDLVYSKGVLNHVYDKETLFEQVNAVLKSNGLFVIADWIFPHPIIDRSGPLVRETMQSYKQVLKNSGFDEIEFRDDSKLFRGYVKSLIENLYEQQKFIEEEYGKETFNMIWKEHQDLIENIHDKHKIAIRIVAKKSTR